MTTSGRRSTRRDAVNAFGRLLCFLAVTTLVSLTPPLEAQQPALAADPRPLEAQQAALAAELLASDGGVRRTVPANPESPLGLHGVGARPLVLLQAAPRRFGRAGAGLGAGVTIGAVALTGMLTSGSGNACTGSGEYLRVCRVLFVGGTALSGALGALAGGLVRRDSPSGRVRPVLLGSSLGALVPFLASIPACGQDDRANPEVLCGVHGMTNPEITIAAAAAGGLIGYLLGGGPGSLQLRHIGPVSTPAGGTALEIAVTKAR
jgi:hypothetical protein